jgi:hypothetical protein
MPIVWYHPPLRGDDEPGQMAVVEPRRGDSNLFEEPVSARLANSENRNLG